MTTSDQFFGYMEAISQTFCSLREEMGLKSINNYTSFFLKALICVIYTVVHQYTIEAQPKCVLFYDATVKCYTWQSFILAAVALTALVIFIIFSTPQDYSKVHVSHCCGFWRWHALHMFVEPFQGQYKDGTNVTHDFRMVSASSG